MRRIDGIYFHETAYSHFFHRDLESLDFGWSRRETARIETRLKLLSVFFDVILISRSHVVVPMNAPHRDVLGGLLHGELFATFMKHGIIAFDARPALDGVSDTERVLQKAHQVNPVDIVAFAASVLKALRSSRFVHIDSASWSTRTGANVQQFLHDLSPYVPGPIAEGLTDIFDRSKTADLPFYQESFIQLLRTSDTPGHIACKVCENTNELSLAVPDSMPGADASQGGLVTHGWARISLGDDNTLDFDRRLFETGPLYALLEKGLGPKAAAKLIQMPTSFFLDLRRWPTWTPFRDDFTEISALASKALMSADILARLTEDSPSATLALVEAAYPPSPWLAEAPGAVFSLASEVTSQANPLLAAPSKALSRVSGPVLDRWIERALARHRRPGMAAFLRTLAKTLS